MTWANLGVGKLHRTYVLRLSLWTPRASLSDDQRQDGPCDWLPGEHHSPRADTSLLSKRASTLLWLVEPAGAGHPFRLAMDAPGWRNGNGEPVAGG
jgi:hypothetical protein